MVVHSEIVDPVKVWLSFKAGEEGALRLLMKQYYAAMHNYGSKFSKNDEFIKDCIQDVFIGMWQYRESLTIPENCKAYLLTSVRRKMLSNKPRLTLLPMEDETEATHCFSIEPSPELALIEEESVQARMRIVSELLGQLSERQREIIYLKFYQGLDRLEIARMMGISDQSVSNLFQKAIHSLRRAHPATISTLIQFFILFWS